MIFHIFKVQELIFKILNKSLILFFCLEALIIYNTSDFIKNLNI